MNRGFTFTELVVVIALTAVLGAMVYPDLSGFMDTRKLETAAGETALALLYAQSASIKGGVYRVIFRMNKDEVLVQDCRTDLDGDGDRCGDSDDKTVDEPLSRGVLEYKLDLEADARFSGVSLEWSDFETQDAQRQFVSFDELGVPSTGGSVILRFGAACREVSVSTAGGLVETNPVACPSEEDVKI